MSYTPRRFNLDGANKILKATDDAKTELTAKLTGISPEAREVRGQIDKSLDAARYALKVASDKAVQVEQDARIYPDGKAKLIAEALAEAESDIVRNLSAVEAGMTVLKAMLTTDALPKPSSTMSAQQQLARQDALMVLDRTPDSRRSQVIAELASRDDDVAALVTGQWGRDYLRAVDDTAAESLHKLAIETAVDAASTSSDRNRAAAAEAREHVGQYGGVMFGLRSTLRELREQLTGTTQPTHVQPDEPAVALHDTEPAGDAA